MNTIEAKDVLRRYLPPDLLKAVLEAFQPEAQPGQPIMVQKAHAGYILRHYPHRSLIVTAQDLRDIADWALLHMQELEQEAQARRGEEGQTASPHPTRLTD